MPQGGTYNFPNVNMFIYIDLISYKKDQKKKKIQKIEVQMKMYPDEPVFGLIFLCIFYRVIYQAKSS